MSRCIKNWWTKWDIGIYDTTFNDTSLTLIFESAWEPPIEWFQKLSELHPDVSIELSYDEPWVWFSGEVVIEWGNIVNRYDYDDAYYGEWVECEWCNLTHNKDLDSRIEVWKKCIRCD